MKYYATSSWEEKEELEFEDFGSAEGRMLRERTPKVVDSGGVKLPLGRLRCPCP